MSKFAILMFGLLAFASVEAAPVSYGRPPDPATFTGDLPAGRLLVNTSNVVTHSGYVTDWSVYGAYSGNVASVILTPVVSGQYQITGVDERAIVEGVNSFSTPAYSGSNAVVAGTLFGLWQEGCRNPINDPVAAGTSTTNPGCEPGNRGGQVEKLINMNAVPPYIYDIWGWSTNSGLRNFQDPHASLGAIISLMNLPNNDRAYSYQINVTEVPNPATFWLFAGGLTGWSLVSWRKGFGCLNHSVG